MNYREQQLRAIIKRDYVPKTLYQKETNELKKARSQDLIDKLQQDLGINFLLDYSAIVKKLKGRTVEEVLQEEGQQTQQWEKEHTQLTQHIQRLDKQIQALTILADKRKEDLEQEKQALITLAKQKIANKKEASELLTNLESKWKQEQEEWKQEKKELIKEKEQLKQELETEQKNKQKLSDRNIFLEANVETFQERIKDRDQQLANSHEKIKQLKINKQEQEEQVKELVASIHQISQENQKLTAELQEKNDWKDDNLPQLKEELFSQGQAIYQELKEQINKTTIAWGRKEIEKKLEELDKYLGGDFTSAPLSEPSQLENNHQEQLRQINLLFDPDATNYETIDFNGLYSLLQQIAEREREREQITATTEIINDDDKNNETISSPISDEDDEDDWLKGI